MFPEHNLMQDAKIKQKQKKPCNYQVQLRAPACEVTHNISQDEIDMT